MLSQLSYLLKMAGGWLLFLALESLTQGTGHYCYKICVKDKVFAHTSQIDARYKACVNYTCKHTCTLRQIHVYTQFIQGDTRLHEKANTYTLHLICTVHVSA